MGVGVRGGQVWFGGWVAFGVGWGGGQGGSERIIEVFVKIQKKNWGWGFGRSGRVGGELD